MTQHTHDEVIAGVNFLEVDRFFSYLNSITEEGKENG